MKTAYENWLIQSVEDIEDLETKRIIIADILIAHFRAKGELAFDIVSKTGDKEFTRETFLKAADLVLKEEELDGNN